MADYRWNELDNARGYDQAAEYVHPYYRDRYDYAGEDFPVAHEAYGRIVSLPLHPGLSDRDVDDVIEAVEDVHSRHRR